MVVILAGIDGTKKGWVAALRDSSTGKLSIAGFEAFLPWAQSMPNKSTIAIDIPIGLAEQTQPGGRSCERACRQLLGPRKASSVFSTPSRQAVYANSWEEAGRIVQRDLPDRKGISRQSWAIFPKVREIDTAISKGLQLDIRESHPEVVFSIMNGHLPVVASKKSEAGRTARIRLLGTVGLPMEPFLTQRPPGCAVDDLIDAFACLWTAGRIHQGNATAHGAIAEAQIWT